MYKIIFIDLEVCTANIYMRILLKYKIVLAPVFNKLQKSKMILKQVNVLTSIKKLSQINP